MADTIKGMQLYPRAERVFTELRHAGYPDGSSVPLELLNQFDQLHYHGTKALDVAIQTCGLAAGQRVLEVGSGWGGCARYLAATSGAHITGVELQGDYNAVGQELTRRTGLADRVTHVHCDFLTYAPEPASFDHAVSWLALFHIPDRQSYLAKLAQAVKPGGLLYVEDLYAKAPPPVAEAEDFQQNLFPNSLVPLQDHWETLQAAGFDVIEQHDMTDDWSDFTATRLAAFHDAQEAYKALHGAEAYAAIEQFYSKMAGYFARGLVGGLRYAARRV